MQYYIIDDLRLPPKRSFRKGWTMEQFPSLREALARYRALPSRQAKSLGMTDGIHVLELARHVLIYPAETAWEDVQAACPETLPLWAETPEAMAAAEECITTLNLRYRISGNMVTPIPPPGGLRRDLRDKYLWLSGESERKAAIRWVYIVGAGWKQPDFLRQWKRYGYPLVPRYQADGITEQGAYLSLEIAPWEYDVLMRRTLERREREEIRVRIQSCQSPMQLNTKIYLSKKEGPALAIASVNLNGCFAVRGIQIREGKNGPFVSMPCRKVNGEYMDLCFPCTAEFKKAFDQAVLDAYHMELRQAEQKARSGPKMGGMDEMK